MDGLVDLQANEALLLQTVEASGQVLIRFELDRKADAQLRPGRQVLKRAQNVGNRMSVHFPTALQAVHAAEASQEQTQVVEDLGHGADGRAWAAGQRTLADGDGRRQIADDVGVGGIEAFQKLAGVGREALQIAAPCLGVERVKRQAALAGPADAGNDGELPQRNIDIDSPQIVHPNAT